MNATEKMSARYDELEAQERKNMTADESMTGVDEFLSKREEEFEEDRDKRDLKVLAELKAIKLSNTKGISDGTHKD